MEVKKNHDSLHESLIIQKIVGQKIFQSIENQTLLEQRIIIRQVVLMFSFSLFAIFALGTFGFYHLLFLQDGIIGTIEIIFAILGMLHILYLRFVGHIQFCKHISVFLLLIIVILLLITGGIKNTGIYWSATLPITSLFLLGPRIGMHWIIFSYLCIIQLFILKLMNIVDLAYTFIEMRQLLVSLVVIAAMVYIFAKRIVQDEQEFINTNIDLIKTNRSLMNTMDQISSDIKKANKKLS